MRDLAWVKGLGISRRCTTITLPPSGDPGHACHTEGPILSERAAENWDSLLQVRLADLVPGRAGSAR